MRVLKQTPRESMKKKKEKKKNSAGIVLLNFYISALSLICRALKLINISLRYKHIFISESDVSFSVVFMFVYFGNLKKIKLFQSFSKSKIKATLIVLCS